jgi:hypothetical protein
MLGVYASIALQEQHFSKSSYATQLNIWNVCALPYRMTAAKAISLACSIVLSYSSHSSAVALPQAFVALSLRIACISLSPSNLRSLTGDSAYAYALVSLSDNKTGMRDMIAAGIEDEDRLFR